MSDKVTLTLDKSGFGSYQISINLVDEQGHGHGYRLLGPKYLGDSTELSVVTLDERDAQEIREYLDHIDGGDKAAEQRGFDRAVALLQDREALRRWWVTQPDGVGGSVTDMVAFLLDANRAAPAVLGIGEQA
jgi:hypothetical protein